MSIDIDYADRYRKGGDIDTPVDLPVGFNPTRAIGRAAASLVADLRIRNKIVCLHAMGKRPATEFIVEFAVRHGLEAELDRLLDRYLELDGAALDVTGARDFPPPPLHVVGQ